MTIVQQKAQCVLCLVEFKSIAITLLSALSDINVCDNGPRHANSIRRFEQFEDTTAVAALA